MKDGQIATINLDTYALGLAACCIHIAYLTACDPRPPQPGAWRVKLGQIRAVRVPIDK